MLQKMVSFGEEPVVSDNSSRVNREFHDSFFTALFSRPENLKQLHEAIFVGESVKESDLKQCTIKRVSVNGVYNDLAYHIGRRLIVLFEHQSTMNPNMPYRMLSYVAEEYKRLYSSEADRFTGTSLVKICRPEFFVIYSGNKVWDVDELRLSDAFENRLDPQLELKVRVITPNNHLSDGDILCDYFDFYKSYHRAYIFYRKKKGFDHKVAIALALDFAFKETIEKE